MESMARIHEAEIRENGETEDRQRKEYENNEKVDDIENEEEEEIKIERSTFGNICHFLLEVFEDIVDQSDVDDKTGLKWYQLTAMTIQAIYYCAAFYWICVLLEREKILSRVLDISEDMGFVREMLGVGLAYYSWKLVPPTVSLIVGPKSDRWEKVWIPQDGEEEERAVQNEFEGSVKED